MATTYDVALQIDHDLHRIYPDLLDLPEIEKMYEEARERGDDTWWLADWSGRELEWQDMAFRIERLSRQYQDGQMSEEQAERYRELIDLLRERVPILKRLNWWLPLVPIEFSMIAPESVE